MNIWQKLAKKSPFFVLAPMDDVTDTVFRQIVSKHAPADLMMTEFANADGYCSPGKHAIMSRLRHKPSERPLIAQIWGVDPANYNQMAADMVRAGFDGVDINMGCPIKDMIKKGACSAMIENHKLAKEVIAATKEGVAGKIPVSVKTRLGFNNIETEEWVGFLLEQGLDAISIHGRTKKEMSKVPANWDEIGKAVKIRNKIAPSTIIVGNGDIMTREEGILKVQESGVDGVMIGRGIFHNLFVFNKLQTEYTTEQMLTILLEHIELFTNTWGEDKSYEPLKKFFKLYINGFNGAASVRAQLMDTSSIDQAKVLIHSLLPHT